MSPLEPLSADLSEMVLRMAGEAGQISLARSADEPVARAYVDQHAAAVRTALAESGQEPTAEALACYARGFMEAAIGRGWWPPHRRRELDIYFGDDLDWESLRLAAVCHLMIESQGLALLRESGPGLWIEHGAACRVRQIRGSRHSPADRSRSAAVRSPGLARSSHRPGRADRR